MPQSLPRVVLPLGIAQTLAWGSTYYLPAILANGMATDTGAGTAFVFAAFSAALLFTAFLSPVSGRIIDLYGGGPVGVEALAATLSEPRDTLEDVVEPFLLQMGFLARTARGRVATERAYKHLGVAKKPGGQGNLF